MAHSRRRHRRQKVIDIAITAGANTVQGVEWNVSDPQSLRAKAYTAALARARGWPSKQGFRQASSSESLCPSSMAKNQKFCKATHGKEDGCRGSAAMPTQNLMLYPSKVEREATVTVIYAIAQ